MPRTTTTPPASSDGAAGRGRAADGRAAGAKSPAKAAPPAKPSKAKAAKAPDSPAPKVPAAKAAPTAAKAPTKADPTAAKGPAKAAPPAKTPAKGGAAKVVPAAQKPALAGRLSGREPTPQAADGATSYAGDQAFLDQQRAALLEERGTYTEQARQLRAEAESLVEEMEPGDVQFDEESGEGGTTTVDRERDLALSAQALAAVEEIDTALEKIDAGRYGVCEGCGSLIPKPRLEALPFARLCIACKSGGLSRR